MERDPIGTRRTRQRAAVIDVLGRGDVFRSAQDLHDELRRLGRPVGLATVYRTVRALAEAGEVDVIAGPSGDRYRRCRRAEHHHHLVCRECGLSVEISDDRIESRIAEHGRRLGFSDLSHSVELAGRCADCGSAR